MGWPQPPTPIQTYNTTAEGLVKNKIVTKKLKYTDLRLHWLRCRGAQKHFVFIGTKDPSTGVTFTQNNNHQSIMSQSAPIFQGALKYYYISYKHNKNEKSKLYTFIWRY